MRKIRAVIFDLDGTLIDSIHWHAQSFHELSKVFGKPISMKKIMPLMRLPTEAIYRRLRIKKLFNIEIEKFLGLRRTKYYSIIHGKNLVFKDVFPALKKLMGCRLAIATNSSRQTLLASTPYGLFEKFGATVTYSDVLRAKPDPEMLFLAAKKLRVKPHECVVAGDSIMDVLAAKGAGMVPIAVFRKTGASTFAELKKKKPFAVIKSLGEVPKIVSV